MAKIDITKTELVWPGKYNEDGTLKEVPQVSLPFQVIETVNESRATREIQKTKGMLLFDIYEGREGDTFEDGWKNKLIWGDNLLVMGSLLEKFAGKIDLIYIDPPFATGADFSFDAQIGESGKKISKEQSVIEEKAYRDTWGKGMDSFITMIYERLVLMRDLLSENGSIYVHCDWRVNWSIRCILDEIFDSSNFRNEILTRRAQTKNLQGQFSKIRTLNIFNDTIFWYSKKKDTRYSPPMKQANDEQKKESWQSLWNNADRPTMRYNILGKTISSGQWKWSKERAYRAVENYKEYVKLFSDRKTLYEHWVDTEKSLEFIRRRGKSMPQYWIPPREEVIADNNWFDIKAYNYSNNYPTEKSEVLLERIIKASSDEGSLVADFFCGSGTTLASAEKLGRRWIGCDLGRWGIHVTRKRLLGIENCKPFEILNLGKYERQYWQGVTFGGVPTEQALYEYLAFILKLYDAQPLSGLAYLHGKKGRALIHIGAVDAPVTFNEIDDAVEECAKLQQKDLHILGWEWEMGLQNLVVSEAKNKGVNLSLLQIPREVMEEQAADKGDVRFFELAYLKATVKKPHQRTAQVQLQDFVIPNSELVPDEVRGKIAKWSDYIDYWAVDWDFQNDTFMQGWVAYRTRKERTLPLISDSHPYENPGHYRVLVKAIDIFGNDTSQALDIEVK